MKDGFLNKQGKTIFSLREQFKNETNLDPTTNISKYANWLEQKLAQETK